jgi:hypothetical protein
MVIKSFDNDILGTHINAMRWAVIDVSASPIRLLLSDRPVQIASLKEPSGFVSMPISPTKLFVATNNSAAFDNLSRVNSCRTSIFSSSAAHGGSYGHKTKHKHGSSKITCQGI